MLDVTKIDSPREREVLDNLIDGMTDKEIGTAMGISTDTVKVHMRSIRNRVGVKFLTRVSLALAWYLYRQENPLTEEELQSREKAAVV